MKIYEFSASLSDAKIRSIYEGGIRYILVYDDSGIKIQLPASNFRRFVTRQGLQGRFRVVVDNDNKIKRLERL